MNKLFMIGLGGSMQGANIEVHDLQFVIAEKLEDTYEVLKNRWYGTSLHIDSYTVMQELDGYKLDLEVAGKESLYMVVYGGYSKKELSELHAFHFVIASSKKQAKEFGKKEMAKFAYMDHIDEVVDVSRNAGQNFGYLKGSYASSNNETIHTFIKLID